MAGRRIAVVEKKRVKKKAEVTKPDTTQEDIFAHFDKEIESAVASTSNWATKQQKWHRLRMRIKKSKSFPFPNCSNIRMPTAETKIRKLKSSLVNVVFGVRPVVQAIPTPSGNFETARKIEKFLDHLIMEKIKLKSKAIIGIDQELEKGFYLFKPYWKFEVTNRIEEMSVKDLSDQEAQALIEPGLTEDMVFEKMVEHFEADMSDRVREDNEKALRKAAQEVLNGADKIKVELKDVLCDYPDVALVSPEFCYVPSDSGYDPQECGFIAHEMYLPLRTLKQNAKEKGWIKDSVDEIDAFKSPDARKLTEIDKDLREGIERLNNPSNLVRIWEVYGWYDINNDGIDEKCVFTLAPEFSKVLRKATLPFSSGKFPFVKIFYELIDDRWFSHRGLPELLEDYIKEIDIQHMQKIDGQTIRNTPMFIYRAGMVNPNNVQFIPNQAIPIHGMSDLRDTIDILNANNPNVEYSYEREEQLLLGRIEELIGQTDFNLQSQINRREPRTNGEVQLQDQSMQRVFSLDAEMHTEAFGELFNWIWDLWCQYGNDEYEFSYFGQDGWEKIRLTREEVQGKYKISVRGNDRNTNPQIKIQKAQTILQAVTNQAAIQMGVILPENLANAYKRMFQTLEIEDWQEFINPKPQPPAQPQPKASENISIKAEDLTDGEMIHVLEQMGIPPDVQGRELHSRIDNIEKGVEIGEKAQSFREPADNPNTKPTARPKGRSSK